MSDERTFGCQAHGFKLKVTGTQIDVVTQGVQRRAECASCNTATDAAFAFAEAVPTP
jgi:hypothetical protein